MLDIQDDAIVTSENTQEASEKNSQKNSQILVDSKRNEKRSEGKKEKEGEEKIAKVFSRLKLTSLIIGIIAGIGSITYTVYSMLAGNDTIIVKPADTVIIQGNELRIDDLKKDDKKSEQSVIDKVLELQKGKKDFIALDYFVGKIKAVVEVDSKGKPQGVTTMVDPLDITIEKIYDIGKKIRTNGAIVCSLDSVNNKYFRKGQEIKYGEIEKIGIKLYENDLIGFRMVHKDGKDLCEIFQINEVNLQEYNAEVMELAGGKEVSIPFEGAVRIFINTTNSGTQSIILGKSLQIPYDIKEGLKGAPILSAVLIINPYLNSNPSLPLANIVCIVERRQLNELLGFYQESNIRDPITENSRYTLEGILTGGRELIPISKSTTPVNSIFETIYYGVGISPGTCTLHKMNIYDMGERNIIENHVFRK